MAQLPLAQVPADMQWDWQELGACRDRELSLFFHPVNARGRARRDREAAAKSVCGSCVVRAECLDYAIRSREPYGVWGGLSEDEREAIFATLPSIDSSREPGDGLRAVRDALGIQRPPQQRNRCRRVLAMVEHVLVAHRQR